MWPWKELKSLSPEVFKWDIEELTFFITIFYDLICRLRMETKLWIILAGLTITIFPQTVKHFFFVFDP